MKRPDLRRITPEGQQFMRSYAHMLAFRAFQRSRGALSLPDLKQEAEIALLDAERRFDPEHGATYLTYAVTLIKAALLRYQRNEDWVPRAVREAIRRTQQKEAAGYALDESDYRELPRDQGFVSLDAPRLGEDGKLQTRLEELLVHPGLSPQEHVEQKLHAERVRAAVHAALRLLPERWRFILHALYWEGCTMVEVSQRLGICESRVYQIRNSAFQRLRKILEQDLAPE